MHPAFQRLRNLDRIRNIENLARIRAPRRVVVDRMNPFEGMTSDEFLVRFRLSKECVVRLIDTIQADLPSAMDKRGSPVPPHLQVLITLRFLATGGEQLTISHNYDISQAYVSRCVKRVSAVISGLCLDWVKMPSGSDIQRVMEHFKSIAGIPDIVGAIDCTHVPIQCPPDDLPELYRNQKGHFSLNVQAVCGPDMEFYNVVARWGGSAHKSDIFENSQLHQEFEDGVHMGHLLGDLSYPSCRYLLIPFQKPKGLQEEKYNKAHARTRSTIKRAFGLVKRRFGCLEKTMRTALNNTKNIVVASFVLHNFAVRENVPLPDIDSAPDNSLDVAEDVAVAKEAT